jgi:transposase InsO family protein
VGYYRRFIENYARLASPLTELLKKDVEYVWTGDRQQAFEELKKRLVTAPILSPPDWGKPFHVTLDASGWCQGAILWQEDEEGRERPIYYASRQMSPAEKNYTATEREALAVIYACKKFRHYLLGYEVTFHTDHDALKYLVNKPDLSGRLARWILLLQEFTYTVVVKSGKSNSNADYLSRQRGPESCTDLPADFPDEFPETPEATLPEPEKDIPVYLVEETGDSDFQGIIHYLQTGQYPELFNREEKSIFQHHVAPYCLIRGVLFRMGADDKLRRCLEVQYRRPVMRALHEGPAGGHFAAVSTIERIRTTGYWWPHLNRDVKEFVRSCDPCQRTGAPSFRNHWPLTPIIPLAPFAKWGIDFIGPILPVGSRGSRYIVLATDYATKWVEARATRRNDAATAAIFLFEQIMMRFGCPLELVSDRGTHFLNDTIEQITDLYHIKHRKTTPYNPKANGLTERANGIVVKILNKVVSAQKTDWDRKLYSAVFAYNTTWKKTTGRTPYFLVFGVDVLQEIELEVETYRVMASEYGEQEEDLEDRFSQIDELEEHRRDSLELTIATQNRRKENFDRKLPQDTGIREGKLVLLFDNRHINFPGKLQTRWMGPFRVSEIFDNGTLQLEQLDGTPLETRTNGSRVKLYKSIEND